MSKPTNAEVDELLSGGYLSGPQYDRILGQVLRISAPAPRKWSWRGICWAMVPAAAVLGGWLLFARSRPEPFTAKGATIAPAGPVTVGCAQRGFNVCRQGDTLMFAVNAAVVSGFLGAYAEAETEGTPRIWYFPHDDGRLPFVERGVGTMVVPQGIRIGPEHRPGLYHITVFVSDRPLTRAELGASGEAAESRRWKLPVRILPQ